MKNFKFSRAAVVLSGALLIGIPTAVLLPGCGGGGSSSISTRVFSAPVRLNSSQTGTLNITLQGQLIGGTLMVPTPTSGTAAITPGTYALTGSFLPPRSYVLNGTFPAPLGTVAISGTIPTSTQTGSYEIKFGDQTVTGTIPIVSPTATPTSTSTATPTSTVTPVGTTPQAQ